MSSPHIQKIGLLGGAFNPIHKGHLHIAKEVWERMPLDLLLFVPSFLAPHKAQPQLLPIEMRLQLIQKAISSHPHWRLCDLEIERKGVSYTFDTLKELETLYPLGEFFFILGSDMVAGLSTWKNIHQILEICQFVVVNRPDWPLNWKKIDGFSPGEKKKLQGCILSIPPLKISSSDIRNRIERGGEISHLVPESLVSLLKKSEK